MLMLPISSIVGDVLPQGRLLGITVVMSSTPERHGGSRLSWFLKVISILMESFDGRRHRMTSTQL